MLAGVNPRGSLVQLNSTPYELRESQAELSPNCEQCKHQHGMEEGLCDTPMSERKKADAQKTLR